MEIKVGKQYVMRDGRVTEPIYRGSDTIMRYWTDGILTWYKDGSFQADYESPLDILSEA